MNGQTITLKKYPRTEEVREAMTPERIAELVSRVPDYQRHETLAKYDGNVNAAVLRAWADFSDSIRNEYPDAYHSSAFHIERTRTPEELETIVIENERTNRYYHPEQYPEYTEGEDY